MRARSATPTPGIQTGPTASSPTGHVERSAAGARHPARAARRPEPLPHERYLWDSGFHWGEWLVPGQDLKGPEEFAEFCAAMIRRYAPGRAAAAPALSTATA